MFSIIEISSNLYYITLKFSKTRYGEFFCSPRDSPALDESFQVPYIISYTEGSVNYVLAVTGHPPQSTWWDVGC